MTVHQLNERPVPYTIKPKTVTGQVRGHNYTLTYNPGLVDAAKRWAWHVTVTRRHTFHGWAATEARARSEVVRRVKLMDGDA